MHKHTPTGCAPFEGKSKNFRWYIRYHEQIKKAKERTPKRKLRFASHGKCLSRKETEEKRRCCKCVYTRCVLERLFFSHFANFMLWKTRRENRQIVRCIEICMLLSYISGVRIVMYTVSNEIACRSHAFHSYAFPRCRRAMFTERKEHLSELRRYSVCSEWFCCCCRLASSWWRVLAVVACVQCESDTQIHKYPCTHWQSANGRFPLR